MRTMTTINWTREPLTTVDGRLLGTIHRGSRGGWVFRISTTRGGSPKLHAVRPDGRMLSQDHRSLKAAKNAALAMLHPAEAMGWNAQSGTGPVQYRAQWDNMLFVVFLSDDAMMFQWRDNSRDYRSAAYPVSGVREAREMAAAVLRDLFPAETPAAPSEPLSDPRAALGLALSAAGIDYTPDQLTAAADALSLSTLRV